MRRPIITQAWLADFYAEGVKPKYKGSLKRQDNNASFEGISEAEYNKRHMKALKDADPGLKQQATSNKQQATSTQVLKHQAKIKKVHKHQATSSKRLET